MNASRKAQPRHETRQFQDTLDRVAAAPEPANRESGPLTDEAAALGAFQAWLHRPPIQADTGVSFDRPGIPHMIGRRLARIESAAQALESVLVVIGADGQAESEYQSVLSPFFVGGLQSAAEILVGRIRDDLNAICSDNPERSP